MLKVNPDVAVLMAFALSITFDQVFLAVENQGCAVQRAVCPGAGRWTRVRVWEDYAEEES